MARISVTFRIPRFDYTTIFRKQNAGMVGNVGVSLTNVVLLSAGQGRRLAPLTDNKPKCLVNVAGRTILEWQLHALAHAGIEDVTVVTGFHANTVEAALKVTSAPLRLRCLNNPFYCVADNISSCWVARDLIGADTVLINGDTLFDQRILAHVLATASDPISVTIDQKSVYDDDDMKVSTAEGRLNRIGKLLTEGVNGESIGMLRFLGEGGDRFTDRLDARLRDPAALRLWYLSIIDELAIEGGVGVVPINGLPWAEVDFPHDISFAAERVTSFDWSTRDARRVDAPRERHQR